METQMSDAETSDAEIERELDRIILKTIYEKIDHALSDIANQDYKRGIDRLRGILPKGYRHSFVRDKVKVSG